jgi:hypothetical protein
MMGNGKLSFSWFFFWFSFEARATGGTVCTGTLTSKVQTDGGYKLLHANSIGFPRSQDLLVLQLFERHGLDPAASQEQLGFAGDSYSDYDENHTTRSSHFEVPLRDLGK